MLPLKGWIVVVKGDIVVCSDWRRRKKFTIAKEGAIIE